jgi:hypothetical protein
MRFEFGGAAYSTRCARPRLDERRAAAR